MNDKAVVPSSANRSGKITGRCHVIHKESADSFIFETIRGAKRVSCIVDHPEDIGVGTEGILLRTRSGHRFITVHGRR